MDEIRRRGMESITKEIIEHSRQRNLRIHASFDLDWHDSSLIQGVGTPVADGGTVEDSRISLELLNQSGLLYSFDIVEVSPPNDDAEGTTVRTAAQMAVTALKPKLRLPESDKRDR